MRSADNFNRAGKFKKMDWVAEDTPAHWFQGEPVLTHLGNSYIIVTTVIECFTIKTALSLSNKINDEQLRLEWDTFTKEEMSHAYQHTCVSNDFKRHKYPIDFMIKYSKALFWLVSKIMSIKSQLALVLAMEFYAHELAMSALDNNLFPIDELGIYDFLRWHAKEELSHSELCLRVYKYFNGGYIRRITMMLFFIFFVALTILIFLPLFFLVDIVQKRKIKLKNISTAFSFLLGRKGLFWGRAKTCFFFFHPRFTTCSSKSLAKK